MRLNVVGEYGNRRWGELPLYIILTIIIIVAVFIWVNIKLSPFIISVSRGYAVNAVSNTLNGIVDEAMREEQYDFINVLCDAEGQIVGVTMNPADTNLLMTKISIGLKERIANMEQVEARIPLGNFLPYAFFAGLGPEVPVRFQILANTSVKAVENFTAQGINQTLYTMSFHVETKVGIYIPTMYSSVMVENELPVVQTLIVGRVPDSYTNVEGMEGTVQDTVLDIE